jgi:hypothetical protein
MKVMNTQEVVMISHRYQSLKDNSPDTTITEIRRYINEGTGDEFVVFAIDVSSPFDVINIFSAGVKWGLSNYNTLK